MIAPRLHVHTAKFAVRWGDMDAYGHVNNVAYFRYFETVRLEWLYAQGKLPGHDPTKGPVMVNGSCDFLVPIVFPADVEVRMYVGMPGRSSLPTYYDIAGNGIKYADGASKLVWIELATGRPTPLPAHIAAPLRKQLKGE
ncbi:MAG: acyl-CoA thioesterase [Burkholderiales bacterium]|nr:acyl-CoA thioesterase [Burkholderiales bacterium]